MAKGKKSDDGISWTRGPDKQLLFQWKIGKEKSKIFTSKLLCAQDFVEKYVQKYPKYLELVEDKTWDEIFKLFNIDMSQR